MDTQCLRTTPPQIGGRHGSPYAQHHQNFQGRQERNCCPGHSDDIPTPLTQNKLKENGVQLTDYLGDYAYFAVFPAAGLEKAVKDVGLIALAPCRAEWKLNGNLRDGNIPDYARSQGGIGCVAYYYDGLRELWVERRLAQLGITNAHIVSIFTSIELTLSREQALQLAEEPWIKSIGLKSPPAELFERDHCSSLRCL